MGYVQDVVNDFVNGKEFKGSRSSRQNDGTYRLTFKNNYLLSYEYWAMAYRYPNGMILVNANLYPSLTTRRQQKELLYRSNTFKIPFEALRRANIFRYEDIKTLQVGEDLTLEQKYYQRGTSMIRKVHFMGETLFKYNGKRYLCGLDRNDNPYKRHFYLCQLPNSSRAKTIEEAFNDLKPKGIGEVYERQGEWFFVPEEPPKKCLKGKRVPIISANPSDYFTVSSRPGRHVAQEIKFTEKNVYVRGYIKDVEHDRLQLSTWHRVYKNRAVASWSTDGRVD